MNILILILFIYSDLFFIKFNLYCLVCGFVLNNNNKNISSLNYRPSIKKFNKYNECSLNDSNSYYNYDVTGHNSGVSTQPSPNSFKLRGIKLDNAVLPLNDYVLILKSDVDDVTKSGVYIGSQRNKDFIGQVIAVGPGKLNRHTGAVIPPSLSVGQHVIYNKPDETIDLKYNDKPCVLVKEENVYARIDVPESSLDNTVHYDKIVPLSDRLLVKVLQSPKKTESGLVISNSDSKDDLVKAQVVSIGAGNYTNDGRLVPIKDLNVGDVVLYSESVSERGEFAAGGVNYSFVRRNAVLAKL